MSVLFVLRIENKDHKQTGVTTHVVVYSNGTCRWTYPLFLHAMCAIDVSYFPLDLQKCSLRFGSMTYSSSEIQIGQPRLVHVTPVYKNKEWMPYKTRIETKNVWDDVRMNNFSVVEVTLSIERDSLYFFIEMLVPCFLISCLTILGKSVYTGSDQYSIHKPSQLSFLGTVVHVQGV